MHVLVLGAGAWGTAIAAHAAREHQVTLWARDAALAAAINAKHENARYLPGVALPATLAAVHDLPAAVAQPGADLLVMLATPLAALSMICQQLAEIAPQPLQLVLLCKGLESQSAALPHAIATRICGKKLQAIATLSGPSFAGEVACGLPCAMVVASVDRTMQTLVQQALHHHPMRIYASTDLIGVELCAAVKNVLAIAAGISDGLALGSNARAALLTRGLAEMERLCLALGGEQATCFGLAGVGDLLLTATGDVSRNRQVGFGLAQGEPLEVLLKNLGHVAEGVRCAEAVLQLAAQHQVAMPICSAVTQILMGKISIADAVHSLLARQAH
jgi:glycerol-3-phosphate dehydrogenase (NAD(P)+)